MFFYSLCPDFLSVHSHTTLGSHISCILLCFIIRTVLLIHSYLLLKVKEKIRRNILFYLKLVRHANNSRSRE
ncbi:hypothetical protein Peur_066522 [Populus x canadensis]